MQTIPGRITVIKRKQLEQCRGCGGSGKQQQCGLDTTRECQVCAGTGFVMMGEGDVWCVNCKGTGKEVGGTPARPERVTCSTCGGFGFVSFC